MKKKAAGKKTAASPKRAAKKKTAATSERALSHETAAPSERAVGGEIAASPERAPSPHLPRVATLFQAIQRDRVGLERSLATKANVDPYHDPQVKEIYNALVDLEDKAVAYLRQEVSVSQIWPWLSQVKGIGERLGGMLIGLIDIRKCNTISALWRFAGYGVVCKECGKPALVTACLQCKVPVPVSAGQCPSCGTAITRADWCINCQKVTAGEAERRVKGQKLAYNNVLKKTCYLTARQFILQGVQPYEGLYRQWKADVNAKHPDWPDGKRDNWARRKMIKLFLEHLWKQWREVEGLPLVTPYVANMPGHAAYLTFQPTHIVKRPKKPKP